MDEVYLDWLFNSRIQMPLRGSLNLWDEMKEKCKNIQGDKNPEELKDLLYALFYELTGQQLHEGEVIYVKKYDPGHGMSSGMVPMSSWVYVIIPTLLKRFMEKTSPSANEEDYIYSIKAKYADKLKIDGFPPRK